MTRRDYETYDYLIAMDRNNLRNMVRSVGSDPEHKVSLLMDHTSRPGDVADPWYTGEFEATWQEVLEGCTALLDAIGYGVEKMVNIQRHLPEDERAEKVIFVITTDGLENASKRFGYEKIRRMIEREKERYGWEFLFLGANMDAVQEAARFGIGADRAVRFENDAQGVAVNYHVVSETVCRMRQAACPASIGAEWKEEIEADFKKRHQE